ncbi:hypothetical protein M430DRAFT_201592 [Amorphotheca resinae ATCC 22711]|uniref:Uncharacterized protein n=1 Tax=Amorphotheca resinae ATCC 22711 TaxID=857342 RepID=A0A2T3BAN6_AMORE|nr:hypothetical protein M430DRAFT_201592 [Amorphotheca resinae ATCC 22711]PSS25391.1 hypothetical protein M430DRAFT_201592 [Amorphotheca resinae ATCC 22711]
MPSLPCSASSHLALVSSPLLSSCNGLPQITDSPVFRGSPQSRCLFSHNIRRGKISQLVPIHYLFLKLRSEAALHLTKSPPFHSFHTILSISFQKIRLACCQVPTTLGN